MATDVTVRPWSSNTPPKEGVLAVKLAAGRNVLLSVELQRP